MAERVGLENLYRDRQQYEDLALRSRSSVQKESRTG